MKSIAAYYVLVAMNSEQQHADRRRREFAAPQPARPSLVARVRALVASGRSTQPAGSAA
jgi:hypothetical protein